MKNEQFELVANEIASRLGMSFIDLIALAMKTRKIDERLPIEPTDDYIESECEVSASNPDLDELADLLTSK